MKFKIRTQLCGCEARGGGAPSKFIHPPLRPFPFAAARGEKSSEVQEAWVRTFVGMSREEIIIRRCKLAGYEWQYFSRRFRRVGQINSDANIDFAPDRRRGRNRPLLQTKWPFVSFYHSLGRLLFFAPCIVRIPHPCVPHRLIRKSAVSHRRTIRYFREETVLSSKGRRRRQFGRTVDPVKIGLALIAASRAANSLRVH